LEVFVTPPRPRRVLAPLACCLAVFAVFATGCSDSKSTKVVVPADGLPAGTPLNDSESHLMTRFEATFDAQSEGEYAKLLTDDFRFHFSQASDPDLVLAYGDSWSRVDETETITHLFDGFTDPTYGAIPGASTVAMAFSNVQVGADPDHPDSLDYYKKVVVFAMTLVIEVPGTPEPTTYNVSSRQEFYIVRGDAAVLASGQAVQADRWYFRRWDDLAISGSVVRKGPVVNPSNTISVGHIKGLFHGSS
jgi:hypothetical protein